jgi:ribosomal protein L37AE/L43A
MDQIDLNIEAIVNRQDFLCRNVPRCEFCSADQVQLVQKNMPAEWRCRICKRFFTFEPRHS